MDRRCAETIVPLIRQQADVAAVIYHRSMRMPCRITVHGVPDSPRPVEAAPVGRKRQGRQVFPNFFFLPPLAVPALLNVHFVTTLYLWQPQDFNLY